MQQVKQIPFLQTIPYACVPHAVIENWTTIFHKSCANYSNTNSSQCKPPKNRKVGTPRRAITFKADDQIVPAQIVTKVMKL